MITDRLKQQIAFVVEVDKLKQIFRQTYLMDRSRKENDAEHSWHFSLMAVLLTEYAAEPVDVLRAVKMALIHDLVEIDAGDVLVYDEAARAAQKAREQKAAERIFALLPADQARAYRSLWEEYESQQSSEARYAAAIDRLQPILHNYHTQGAAWKEHGVTYEQVVARNKHIANGAPRLWNYVETLLCDAVDKGFLKSSRPKHA